MAEISEIEKLSKEEQRANYLLTKQDDVRITGLFPKQQIKVRDDIFKRRKKGYAVSTIWARDRMTYHCQRDKPSGYDPTKHKFLDNCVENFLIDTIYPFAVKQIKKNFYF